MRGKEVKKRTEGLVVVVGRSATRTEDEVVCQGGNLPALFYPSLTAEFHFSIFQGNQYYLDFAADIRAH